MPRHCTYRQEVIDYPSGDEPHTPPIELADDEEIIDVDSFDGRMYLLIQRCSPSGDAADPTSTPEVTP